jgi:hypothetical protein
MIIRIWPGWTTLANAGACAKLLRDEIFVGIAKRSMGRYRGIELLRHKVSDEVEFITMVKFDSLEATRTFAGDDCEQAVVPDRAQQLLKRFDRRSQLYSEIVSAAPV